MKIKSIANPNYRYILDDSDFSCKISANFIDRDVFYFDTLGDNDIQHTSNLQAPSSMLQDFCLSFIKHVTENLSLQNQSKLERGIKWLLPQEDPALVKFLSTVKYRDGKIRYYNPKTKKISNGTNKKHDKRWKEIPSYADGSIGSIFNMYIAEIIPKGLLSLFNSFILINNTLETIYSPYDGIEIFNMPRIVVNDLYLTVTHFNQVLKAIITLEQSISFISDIQRNHV